MPSPRVIVRTAFTLLAAIVAPVAAAHIVPATADAAPAARMEAVATARFFPGSRIAVVAKEDSELNARLSEVIAAELSARDMIISDTSPLRLIFSTEVEDIARARQPFSLFGSVGSESRARLGMEVDVADLAGPAARRLSRYQLWMVAGRSGEPPIWQASATARLEPTDPFDVQRQMVAAVLGYLGETVPDTPIAIDAR